MYFEKVKEEIEVLHGSTIILLEQCNKYGVIDIDVIRRLNQINSLCENLVNKDNVKLDSLLFGDSIFAIKRLQSVINNGYGMFSNDVDNAFKFLKSELYNGDCFEFLNSFYINYCVK